MKIYDEVLGRDEKIQGDVTPEVGIEIKLKEIEPQISYDEALAQIKEENHE